MAKRTSSQVERYQLPTDISECPFYGIPLDEEQKDFANAILNPNNLIIFCNAKAGTGKTTVATGVANLLVQCDVNDGIVYIASPVADSIQGYLPGSITEKSSVYFEACYQALITCNINPNSAINDESMVNQKNGTGYITCITDTYLRGSNLDNKVIIIDEAQNFTVAQLKKVLTRVSDKSKTIVIGHDKQCDLSNPATSGFTKYIEHFKNEPYAAVCELKTNHRGIVSTHADALEF